MVHLTIDGQQVAVPKGTTVWHAARRLGIEIPVFCYHDHMPPIGACRMCFVEVEKMPKLATSCTLEAVEDMVVRTATDRVKQGQRGILEFLLVNHPLDCPICDKGGECPLQDNTLKFGPGASRFVETKRTFGKHVRMGPVLVLDRERCVLCWRCVRFGEIIAGDDALKGFERGYQSQIATPFMEPVESKFIGNTIGICPVGALTSATYRFRSRPWDNRPYQSVCPHCGCGCASTLDVRGNDVTRMRAREHPEVNDIWLCDKGFFGYDFTGSTDRLHTPLVRDGGRLREASWDEALTRVAGALRETPPGQIGVIGGAAGTNEDAYLLTRLFRGVVGTNSIDFRADTAFPQPAASAPWGLGRAIRDVERADVIVLLGCDLTEEYPIVWLRVKKAVDGGARLVIANPWTLEIERFARHSFTYRRGTEPAVLAALSGQTVSDAAASGVDAAVLRDAAALLGGAGHAVVLAGRQALEQPEGTAVVAGLAALRSAHPDATVGLLRGCGNAGGAQVLGLLPDMLPGYRPLADTSGRAAIEAVWSRSIPSSPGRTVRDMLAAARDGDLRLLYVARADPAATYPAAGVWAAARKRLGLLVVHETFLTQTAADADVVLPVLTYAETAGTVGNLEGRIQRRDQAVLGPGEARSDSAIFTALASLLGAPFAFSSWEDVSSEIARLVPGWAEDARIAPPAVAPRPDAANLPGESGPAGAAAARDGPDHGPADGRLALVTGAKLFDRSPAGLRCPGVRSLAGEAFVALHPDDGARLGVAAGDLCEVRSGRGALRLIARMWPGLHPGHAYVPLGFEAAPVAVLLAEGEAPWVTVRAVVPAARECIVRTP